MGNRLSKIMTRTGDKCSTGLADGSRAAAFCHVARSVTRCAERDFATLHTARP